MKEYDTIIPIIDRIETAKEEAVDTLEYITDNDSSIGVHYDSATDRLYEVVSKLLYCKATGYFTTMSFPFDLSSIGYDYATNFVANTLLYHNYYMNYLNIAVISELISIDLGQSQEYYDAWDSSTSMKEYYRKAEIRVLPNIDSSTVTNMNMLCSGCQYLIVVPEIDCSACTNLSNAFSGCTSLQEMPPLKTTGNATTMTAMFSGCAVLKNVPYIDASSATNLTSMFNGCTKLQNLKIKGIKADLDLSGSPELTHESLIYIINNAAEVENKTLTLGLENYSKLTPSEVDVAEEKGWNVTTGHEDD